MNAWEEYNAIDGAVTLQSWHVLKEDLEKHNLREIYDWTIRLFPPLIFMMTHGLRVDQEHLAIEKERIQNEWDAKQTELNEIAGFELNPNSPKQCIAYFYGTLGHKPYTGGTGSITTDDKAMARLVRKGVKEARLVQEIRNLRKLHSTYLEATIDSDGRLRCSMNPRGTYGGRLSSSQTIFGTGLNLQNLDPRFKPFIIADENHVFLEIDKAKAEWVVTAYASGDARMIQAVESGEDVHVHTASLITGVPKELIAAEDDLLGHMTDPTELEKARREHFPDIFQLAKFLPRSMTCRQAGKRSNHGLNYIMKYRRFALENEMPENEAKPLVQMYHEAYAGLPKWWDRIAAELKETRTVSNCYGRTITLLDKWGEDLIKNAVAFVPQSTVADLVNRALIMMYEDTRPHMYPLKLGAQVHDSIFFQYPITNWEGMAQCVLDTLDYMNPTLKYGGREFQIESDLKLGLNWGNVSANNPKGMQKVKLISNKQELAERLRLTYEKATS